VCGIIGYVGRRAARELLLAGLLRLEYRGYDSAGVALVSPGAIAVAKTAGGLIDLERAAAALPAGATVGIGHTRWATHGQVTDANAHPFLSCDGRLALVLNGIVENHVELRAELHRNGHVCTSETDAEVVVHLIEESLRDGNELVSAVDSAAEAISGQFAFVLASADMPDLLIGFRRRCPLVVGHGLGETFLASMPLGFSSEARSMTAIDDGELVTISADTVRVYRDGRGRLRASVPTPDADETVSMQGFPAFMLKELFEQADTLERLLHIYVAPDSSRPAVDIGLAQSQLEQIDRVLLLGCGTSYHATLAASFAFEAWSGIRTDAAVASEWRYGQRLLIPGRTLVVAVSQSGETADTLGALSQARGAGAWTIAVSNIEGSQITREAHAVLLTHSGLEIGVAATKTFSSQLALLLLLALQLARQRRQLSDLHVAVLVEELLALPDAIDRFFASEHRVDELARRLKDARFFFLLGRLSGFAACLEGALKIKELTYIPVEVHPAGEMKHGPIALVDEGTPVVCVATDQTVRDKLASNISEVRARGASVIAIVGDGAEEMQHLAEDIVLVPDCNPLMAPILAVLPLQLLAYELATELGLDVDRPRNLAKTVTVE
jgi:glutamine---fructose-6-phosphate transaminase (isomerizing)